MVWANAHCAHWPTPSLRSLGAAPPPRGKSFAGKWAAGIYTQNQLEPVRGSAAPGKKFCGKMGGGHLYTKPTRARARQRRPGEKVLRENGRRASIHKTN